MSRQHPSASVHERWTEIIKDYEGTHEFVTFRMSLGGWDVSKLLDSGTLSYGEDGLPWMLSVQLTEKIPIPFLNAPVRFWCEMAGAQFMLFRGRASYPKGSTEWVTQIDSLTPGTWMANSTLDDFVEENGVTPEAAIRRALYRVPYDKGLVKVERFRTPLIYRLLSGSAPDNYPGSWADGFQPTDSPGTMLDSYLTELQAVSFDHPLGGNFTIRDPGVGVGQSIAWTYETNSSEVLESFQPPAWANPDEQYTRVRVVDYLEDGTERIPHKDYKVDYTGMPYPPDVQNTFYVNLSDRTPEAEQRAKEEAKRSASLMGRGLWRGSITTAFNPFLMPYDALALGENYTDMTGRYRRIWRAMILNLSLQFGTSDVSTAIDFKSALLLNRRIPDPPIILKGVTAGNKSGWGPLGYKSRQGPWLDPSQAFWGINDSRGPTISTDIPARYGGYDSRGPYVEVPL
jgi:hypothetical protein